jgi:CTP:molybdopterin cytidylyltransferase MocA
MFWRALEARRKRPAAMAAQIGWGPLLLYALGRLSSAGLTHAVARRTGVRARLVALPFAEAAIDVDTPADLALVRRIFSERR